MAFRYDGSGWRVAGSIRTFGDQIMALRGSTTSYWSDGTLGDDAHSNRVSDHNPDENGIVRALDFYEHETGIVDKVAETLRLARDPRLKYFIHDKRMFSSYISPTGIPAWTWRSYGGVNGHITHGHLSVVADSRAEQTHPWPMPGSTIPTTPTLEDDMVLKKVLQGQTTAFYAEMQARVNVPARPGDPAYWGSDTPEAGTPSEAEWDDALDDFVGALFQMAVWPPVQTGRDLSGYSKIGHGHAATVEGSTG